MEDQLSRLVDKVWDKYLQTPPDRRLLIAIGGIPGSGKTTLATTLVTLLNARHQSTTPSTSAPLAAYIPMDGYHLTRAHLSSLPDPILAHARRGAEFTFDGVSFLSLITSLRAPSPQPPSSSSQTTIYAPSFDHALKDPVPNSIPILPLPGHAVVVVEGIYVLLDKEPWREAAGMFDLRVYLRVERDKARERLVGRHVAAGIAGSREEAEARVRENDLVNGDLVEGLMVRVDVVLDSREDEGWVHG
ncbi:P-loop containing nucleoside triphosphate hydrolase protein [Coniochaeta ligniaria NRRL 30616]|uniref:p-loop containing nucleoside triphosphate hydrolase protein n=1 Tax=Coniochaeta ligniaria NRRL 30616 TaxID=1408157 RepID=A0A1J7INS0_9PEZI|nr:P-loop containing nucleoside triphosphate hydrolase protein [Coniochaeta ligniaria NRRL 30616]